MPEKDEGWAAAVRWESKVALEDLHLGAHFRRGLIAQVAVLFQRPIENALELRRQVRIELAGRNRIPVENAFKDDRRRIAVEGRPAGGHLVECGAKGKEVRAAVEFFSPRLLGRHVGDGSEGAAGAGQVFQRLAICGRIQVAAGVDLRQTRNRAAWPAVFW